VRGFDDHHRRAFDLVASAEAWRAFDRVHLDFFAGLPLAEMAQLLGISPRTADRLGPRRGFGCTRRSRARPRRAKKSKTDGVIWLEISHCE
jgi:hypothetical protein